MSKAFSKNSILAEIKIRTCPTFRLSVSPRVREISFESAMGTQRRSLINSATNELIARPTTKPESKSASTLQSLPQRRTALFFIPVNRNSHFVPNLGRRPKHGWHAHARIPLRSFTLMWRRGWLGAYHP